MNAGLCVFKRAFRQSISWDDIDPAIFVDDDGQAYMYLGNISCKVVQLAKDMIHTEGDIVYLNELRDFTEAPYINNIAGIYFYLYGENQQWSLIPQ